MQNFDIENDIDWDQIVNSLIFDDNDFILMAKIVVKGITDRILDGRTANEESLDENSPMWLAKKMREGRNTAPLQYTGELSKSHSYNLVITERNVMIELLPSKRQLHLDLIDISERTGKNYKDFFAMSSGDIIAIMALAEEILADKLSNLMS